MQSPEYLALLGELASALSAEPVQSEPPEHHLDLMGAAVAFHFASAGPSHRLEPHRRRVTARRTARVGAMAASLVLAVTSAAAASGVAPDGLPLPRPLRAVADAVGLPVDSVALDDTRQHLRDLREAARSHDHPRVQRVVAKLHEDISRLREDERRQAQPEVVMAVTEAAGPLNIPLAPTPPVEEHGPTGDRQPPPVPPPVAGDPDPSSADTSRSPTDTTGDGHGLPEDGLCQATSVEPAEIDTAAGPPPEAMDAAPLTGEPDAPSEENLSNLQAPPSTVLNASTATTAPCGSS